MARERPSSHVRFDPFDPDTAIRTMIIGAVVFLIVAIVSFIGEVVGWWDLAGEIGMAVGSIGSVLLGMAAILLGAGRRQVSGVGEGVRSVGLAVRSVGHAVGAVHNAVLDNGHTLDDIELKLEKLDKLDKLDRLDAVHLSLEAQTGVLDRQLGLLGQIRDRL